MATPLSITTPTRTPTNAAAAPSKLRLVGTPGHAAAARKSVGTMARRPRWEPTPAEIRIRAIRDTLIAVMFESETLHNALCQEGVLDTIAQQIKVPYLEVAFVSVDHPNDRPITDRDFDQWEAWRKRRGILTLEERYRAGLPVFQGSDWRP
jgi:hypothetical protein